MNRRLLFPLSRIRGLLLAVVFFSVPAMTGSSACAQLASAATLSNAPSPQPGDTGAVTISNIPMNILRDQAAIWTSPARVRKHDLTWLVPLATATGVALASDHHTMTEVVSHNAQFNHDNVDASNVMLSSLIAVPVVNFAYGEITGDEHSRETGILGGETLADAAILEQGIKLMAWRERPEVDNGKGRFWQSSAGLDSSFPSSHSLFAWSTAAMIAGEHPAPWSQFTVYTLATGVSLTRVLGQKHFPSDVLVGGSLGWLTGHYVYKVRHQWRRNRE
jgi:hypothetical protein